MPLVALTELTIKHLPMPLKGQVVYLDKNGVTGFGVRVTAAGHRSYVLTYGPERRRVTIGEVGVVKLAEAREKAKTILAQHQLGEEEKPPAPTFDDVLHLFLNVHCKPNNKPATALETERLLTRHFLPSLETKPIDEIKTLDVMTIVDGLLETPSEANHAFTAARTMFRWARGRGYIDRQPLDGLKLPAKTRSRERVLSTLELASVLATARKSGQYGAIVQLLALTGQRLSQIAGLHREWIDQKEKLIHFPSTVMKAGVEHVIPLGDMASNILAQLPAKGLLFRREGGQPFNNWSNSKIFFDKQCPLPHWTLHDLRRTFSTSLAMMRIQPHVIERLLAHTGGTISGVALIYNRHTYLPEMRNAIALWESHLAKLMLS